MINVEENLREICRRKGLRLSDVADRMGSGQSNLISSVKGNPSLAKLDEIANALQVSVSELLTMHPESSQGLVVIGGSTYALSLPSSTTVQIPSYGRYDELRDSLKKFIVNAVKDEKNTSKMGFVETYELFSLSYDAGSQRFILALCYASGKTTTITYDKLEFCDWSKSKKEDDAPWDIESIYTEIINDIEGCVRSLLQTSSEVTILRRKKRPILKKVWDVPPPGVQSPQGDIYPDESE